MNAPGQVGPELWLILLIPAFWCMILALISLMGGWHALAKKYRDEERTFRIHVPEDGKRFRCTSMSLGPKYFPTNYGNCLTIRVTSAGIGIKVWPLFRMMHPPLLIPWRDVEGCVLEKPLSLVWRVTVSIKDMSHPLRFYGRVANGIHEVWSQRAATQPGAVYATH